jgi:DNA-directed RNA polymerase subunit RPC12/RpoP
MPDVRTLACPNCSAPMTVPLGETEFDCEYCDSRVRLLPNSEEMEVVRTREEMKRRERVALAQARLRKQLEHEEAEAWRQTAAKVAIAALPIVGRSAGHAFFRAALRQTGAGRGCLGCGCVLPIVLVGLAAAAAISTLTR